MGIYNRKQESKKESKHAFDQESDQEKKEENGIGREKKKERRNALDQESKIQEKTITIKKKEGRKWKTQIKSKHLASFFSYIQFGRIDK